MSGFRVHLGVTDPLVRDHRIGDTPVVPAALQTDAVLTACDTRRPDRVWTLDNVTFRAPLRVTGPGVDLRVTTADDGRCSVLSAGDDAGGAPVEHSSARARGVPMPPPRYVDVGGLWAGCTRPVPLTDIEAWRQASGITYGPAYRAIRSAYRGADRMLVVLRADDDLHTARFVPPPLLDSVFQALGMLDDGTAGACLPWYVGRLVARRPISGTVLALVERDATAGARAGAVRGRATVCSQQGEVLLELERITLKSPTAGAPTGAAADERNPSAGGSIETPVWREVRPTRTPRERQGPLLLVSQRRPSASDGPPVIHLTPQELTPERLDEVLDGTPVGAVVYEAPRGPTDEDRVGEALRGVFALVRRLAARPPMPDLLIVTSGAHRVTGEETVDPFMTSLWGLGRTLCVEHPRTEVRLVDLEPGADLTTTNMPTDLLGYAEPELARRPSGWYRPTLEPAGPAPLPPSGADAPAPAPRFRDGRFLITGGMGGIGLRIAESLAAEGCAHLTLVGRTVPDTGETRTRLDRLGTRCDLHTLAADVRTLPKALDGAERFDGVFHAAGVLRDGLARTLTPEQVTDVLGPKVGGVHAIDDLIAASGTPDFVALFSSVASVRANLGQSAYATANAYLDGYAARRRADGAPWFSLGWGLWSVGMGEGIAPKAAAHGVPVLTADSGVALLRTVLGRPPAHYVLCAAAHAKEEPMTVVTPESGLWLSLTTALKNVLHVDAVAPEDDLLELGLDSMMAVELAASLSADGFEVDPMVFFEHSTVGALVNHLQPSAPPSATEVPPAQSRMTAVPTTPAPVNTAFTPVVPPTITAPEQPAPAVAVRQSAADSFVPDWDRFRTPASDTPHEPPTAGAQPI
ncbi:SDR family NAD(P)-dependent oxidoreductase, partial [Streptomyces torulosus]|uniref:SDR family NAD(P)-dependent oxidoreductase n=1 Tax=Streptomyces torulosus TaxID=68276 RepID=UPI0006EB5F67